MDKGKKIKLIHINGDHYIATKTTMKIYELLKKEINKSFRIDEIIVKDKELESLNNCQGCKLCFKTGRCIFDSDDSILDIKNKLLISDLVIISTPIFIDNISGNLKTLFDRLSYWFHTMPLIKKRCILIVSTYRSGKNDVSKYLYKVCSYLGMDVVGLITSDHNTKIIDLKNQIDISLDYLVNAFSKEETFSSYKQQIFHIYDHVYENMLENKQMTFESTYWYKIHH